MLADLKNFLSSFAFLTPKDIADFVSVSKVVKYKKGETIFVAGEMSYNMNVVLSGYVRTFITREDGEERTVHLAGRGMGFGSSKTLLADRVGNETAIALENSVILIVHFEAFRRKADKNPTLYKMYAKALEKGMLEAIERVEFHSVMLPDQRYEYLMRYRPEVLEQVPLKYVASYIGITPVSLSRLRARMVKRNT